MSIEVGYRNAFLAAVVLHCCLLFFLLIDPSNQRAVMVKDTVNEPGQMMPIAENNAPKPDIVKAVSVDSQQVAEVVNRLKSERAAQAKAEQAKQQALQKQADMAKRERVLEQQRLAKLKDETEKLAIMRKKQIEEDQKHLKQLAIEKEQEAKRLATLKNQQQELEKKKQADEKRFAELQKKESLDKAEKQRAQEAANEEARKQAASQQAAAANAAKQARIAGEVDKYKAMIVNAISSRWILPDNVDKGLSSQFRIRLAPDGAVLEVSLLRSSGDPVLDRSAQSAIYKASPLPVPSDADTFNLFREISLTVRPENVRG